MATWQAGENAGGISYLRRDGQKRYRAHRDAELAKLTQQLEQTTIVPLPIRARTARPVRATKPMPSGIRRINGFLFSHEGSSFIQVTARKPETLPPGRPGDDCYLLTSASIGCG